MILCFTGTGNSFAVGHEIAQATGDRMMPLAAAPTLDLGSEPVVGLVYPCYDFNTPPAVRELVSRQAINPEAYVFIVVTCGAQTGNSIWTVRRLLSRRGIAVAYSHKIRMPDNSAAVFGRNPNAQAWKFDRYAGRLQQIAADIKSRRRGHHYASWGLAGWLAGLPAVERRLLGAFRPAVDADRCIGCGLCTRVCPVGNIAVAAKATIGDRCTACLGCLHACPQQAVAVGSRPTPKAHQYRHPGTSLPFEYSPTRRTEERQQIIHP